jgi:hypothetical protein
MNLLDNSQVTIRGLDQHFERVDMANRKKRELEGRMKKNNGDKWKHQITIPQEFNFQIANRPSVNDISYSSNNYHSPIKGSAMYHDKSQDKIERNLVWVEKNGRGPFKVNKIYVFNFSFLRWFVGIRNFNVINHFTNIRIIIKQNF